ncbi:MAG TPA: type V CRISPR-associated protein C2c8 [Leptolyngbyaceae cyanobacterium]
MSEGKDKKPCKTLEFKLYLTPQQQQRIDNWLLIQKWVWNRGLGLIEEFNLWNPWNKETKQYNPIVPETVWRIHPETRKRVQLAPEEWKVKEPLVELISKTKKGDVSKGFIRQVRIAPDQPGLTKIDYFGLLNLFAHKLHKDRVIVYGNCAIKYTDCPSKFIAGTIETLANAYKAFLSGKRKFPKFKKSRDTWDTLINNNSKEISIEGDFINIPKIGWVKVKGLSKRWPQGMPFCPLKICRKASAYYLQLTGEIDNKRKPKLTGKSAGLDPGNAYVYSDDIGHQVEPPKFLRKQLEKLRSLQKKQSRQFQANSYPIKMKVFGNEITVRKPNQDWQRKNYRKTAKRIAKLHEKIARQRRAFNHFHSTKLVNCYDELYLEDFQTANLGKQNKSVEAGETVNQHGETVKVYKQNGRKRKSGMIKSMRDNATGQLWSMIEQKAEISGKVTTRVPAHYTTQTCPNCGGIKPKKLCDRVHKCEVCGYTAPRDVAAAQVIKQIGKSASEGRCQIKVTPETASTPSSVRRTRKRKSKTHSHQTG